MCQSESPNEAGNTWLVGWMISTGWYLKTRENQESSQQKTHTLLPSIRKSMHNWHIYYIFLETPIIAGDNCFLRLQHQNCLFWLNRQTYYQIVTNHMLLAGENIILVVEVASDCRLSAQFSNMWLLKCCFQCAEDVSSCDGCPVVSWHFPKAHPSPCTVTSSLF